jgi:hypothetical protein
LNHPIAKQKSLNNIMPEQANVLLKKAIDIAGWQLGLVTKEDFYNKSSSLSSSKQQIARSLLPDTNQKVDNELFVDAIYFSGDHPFIYFKKLSTFDPVIVKELHCKVWNEGRVPLLSIITPQEIRFYDCFDTPGKDNLDKLERGGCFQNEENDLKRLGELLHQSKIDTGLIWQKGQFGEGLKKQNRVDRKLVRNLSEAKNILHSIYHIPLHIVHDLLGRSLFALYLEDREIRFSEQNNYKGFFEAEVESIYQHFHFLKEKFNGDLFPVTSEEEMFVKNDPNCLQIVKQCFSEDEIGQETFWRMFRFQYIPIEFISSVYEEFMSDEDIEHNSIDKKRKEGAYYTRPMLVEFMLNEILPWPDEKNKQYDLKILDPACGSGIFLVESYKRLIARWKHINKTDEVSKEVLEKLLLNNIFGIEKDKGAIKVAAFSLYLTMLNYIEPQKVISGKVKFKPLVRWSDKKELTERNGNERGNNLFQFNTFASDNEIFDNKFDIVVGNPPWKKGEQDEHVENYYDQHKLPKQIMCAYLRKISLIAPQAKISLVSTAKVLFNTGKGYESFRRNFFTDNDVDIIVNLSVVRDVIFKNAKAPAVIVNFRRRRSGDENARKESVVYCVPKSVETIDSSQSIIIDASEIKYIPFREVFKEDSKIFKIAMWGNVRDMMLINKLNQFPSLKGMKNEINCGMGLIHDKAGKKGNPLLSNHKFLETEYIKPYYTDGENLSVLGERHKKYRKDGRDLYDPPLILFKEGTYDDCVCSSYIDYKCAFQSSSLGIKLKNRNPAFHKALVACYNSSIGNYYYFLTSSNWEISKGGQIQKNEAKYFPAFPYSMNTEAINLLAKFIDDIINIKDNDHDRDERVKEIQREIDITLYRELKITDTEIKLIEDVLNYSSALQRRYIASKAVYPANIDKDVVPYAKTMAKTITSLLKHENKGTWVEVLDSGNTKDALRIVALRFNKKMEYGTCHTLSIKNISGLIADINKYVYELHSESIYYRKVVKYYKPDTIYLVKPNQKRFWSISQALNDADGILLDLTKPRK